MLHCGPTYLLVLRPGALTLRVGLQHLNARPPHPLCGRHRWLGRWPSHRPLMASVPLIIQLFPIVCSDDPPAGLCRLPVAGGDPPAECGLALTLLLPLVHHIVQELISLPLHTLSARLVIRQLALRHRVFGLPPRGRLQLPRLLPSKTRTLQTLPSSVEDGCWSGGTGREVVH